MLSKGVAAGLAAAAAFCFVGAARADATYTITDLGPPGVTSWARAINDAGEVVGYYFDNASHAHGFVWRNGSRTDVPTLGGSESAAFDVNNDGDVVGYASLPGDAEAHAFVMRGGALVDLGTLGGPFSEAVSINDAGEIAGSSFTTADTGETRHAVVWQGGTMIDLGTLGGTFSYANGISETGYVTGDSQLADGRRHAYLWHGEGMVDIGTLGGANSFGYAKNRQGVIVGESDTAANESHAFRWYDGVMTDLGTLGGRRSAAVNLNEAGWIVGESDAAMGGGVRATLWRDGQVIDLNTQVDAPEWRLIEANDINARGQIVGLGQLGAELHAFLLSPRANPSNCDDPVYLHAVGAGRSRAHLAAPRTGIGGPLAPR